MLIKNIFQEEDYPGAIQLCLECQKAASTFKHFTCIRYDYECIYCYKPVINFLGMHYLGVVLICCLLVTICAYILVFNLLSY